MKIWIFSDSHLGHAKMIEYCGRPENHSDIILENLHDLVRPGDMLIHLGDVCIGNDGKWHSLLDTLLPDTIRFLIKGNHDSKSVNWYLEHGWNIVEPSLLFQYAGKKILFTHRPTPKTSEFDINIHGHMHNNLHRMDDETKKWYDPTYNKLLEIETNGYNPVLLEEFVNS